MTPTEYSFISDNEDGDYLCSRSQAASWPDLADRFYDFLLGCGFQLSKQDLSDVYDQSCFEQGRQSDADCDQSMFEGEPRESWRNEENHAERFGMEPTEDNLEEDDSPKVEGPDQSVPRLLGSKLYEFTVSDAYGKGIERAWYTAREAVSEQIDFEIQSGGVAWPEPWRLFMTDAVVKTGEDYLTGQHGTAMVYSFEVRRV